MGIYDLKPAFRRLLRSAERRLVRHGVRADAITAAGVVFAVVGGLGVWLGRGGAAWLSLVPLGALLRIAANALDGMVAASTETARPMGEVFNETADRIADVIMFLPLLAVPGVPDPLVAVTLAAMLTTSHLGVAIKAAGGSRVYGGIMAKPDRMLVLGAAALLALVVRPEFAFMLGLWVVTAGCGVTFVERAVAARRQLSSMTGARCR